MSEGSLTHTWRKAFPLPEGVGATAAGVIGFYSGLVGFLAFAVTLIWGPAIPQIALVLLLPYLILWAKWNWGAVRRSPLFWMSLAFGGYAVVRSLVGAWVAPETYPMQVKGAADLLQIGGLWVIPLLPWLVGAGRKNGLALLLGFALAGFLIQAVMALEWGSLQGFVEQRPHILVGPNALGAITGFFLLLSLTVGFRWLGQLTRGKPRGWRGMAWAGWLLALGFLLFLLLATQSRANWVAAAVTLPAVLGAFLILRDRVGHILPRRELVAGLAAVVGLVAMVLVTQWHLVGGRLNANYPAIQKVVSLRFSELPVDSVGRRVRLYAFGARELPARPLFGWSPGGVKGLINENAGPAIRSLDHIHNLPLQIALEAGAVGFLLFFGMVGISVREVALALKAGRLPWAWGLFWLGAVAFLGIQGLFDARAQTYYYGVLMILLGAVAMTCQLERLVQEGRAGRES